MIDNERANHPSRHTARHGRVQVRAEERNAAWLWEDIGATLTLVGILVGIVTVRLLTIS
jgi:hypothetical protein